MSEGIIKVVKIISKDEDRIIVSLQNIDKTENLKNIRI